MSSGGGTSTVWTYKFDGDVSGAGAAVVELKQRLAGLNKDAVGFAREFVKGNQGAQQSLLDTVKAADQVKGKINEITDAVKKGQAAGGGGGLGAFFTIPKLGQLQAGLTSIAFGIDDAVQQYAATGRLSDSIRAAGNNLTMLASLFGPVAVVATAVGTSLAMFWTKQGENSEDAKNKLEEYKKSFKELEKLQKEGRGATEDSEKRKELTRTVFDTQAAFDQAKEQWKMGLLGGAEYRKAELAVVTAKEGMKQFEQSIVDKDAAKKFAGAKDDLKKIYQEARGGGATPARAEDVAMDAIRGYITSDAEAKGARKMIKGIGAEEEGDLVGRAIVRGLADPRKQDLQALEEEKRRAGIAQHAEERAVKEQMREENRRTMTGEERAAIGEKGDVVQKLDDLIKVLRDDMENDKQAREERLSKVAVPKGLGAVGN